MQTASSARRTCISSRSALEWTATVLLPSSLQARRMRRAISPRLAMSTLSSMMNPPVSGEWRGAGHSADHEHRLVELHRLAVLDQEGLDHAVAVGLDLVHHLHRLDDAHGVALLHAGAHFHEGLGARGRAAVEGAHQGRVQAMAREGGLMPGGGFGRSGARRRLGSGLLGGGIALGHGSLPAHAVGMAADADRLLTLLDLDFADVGLFEQLDQLLDLADIHDVVPIAWVQ